jgi:tetratricopeptide (TPR) repeat protein
MSSTIVTASPDAPENAAPEFDLLTWFEVNKKIIAAAFAALVLAVITMMIVRYNRDRAEAEAGRALLAATTLATPEAKLSSQALLLVADSHHGTHASEHARLLAAGQLFAEGKYAEAQAQFARFNTDYPDSLLAGTAALGIASVLDAQGKSAEAIAAYQRVIGSFGTESVAIQAKLAKAALHEAAQQSAEALALYDDLLRTAASQPVMAARARLLQQHPELEKPMATNAPVAPAAKAVAPVAK